MIEISQKKKKLTWKIGLKIAGYSKKKESTKMIYHLTAQHLTFNFKL